jgi:outer membrane receptor for ferrienterochelin and colicin
MSNYVIYRNNAKGVETMVAYSFSSALKVNANYTFTQGRAFKQINSKTQRKYSLRLSGNTRSSLLLITSLLIKGKMFL